MTDIFCGSVGRALPADSADQRIILSGAGANAVLNLDHLCRPLVRNVPRHFHDLLEIATYIYVADQMNDRRGRGDGSDYGKLWRRQLHFHISVRDPGRWNRQDVMDALVEAVGFLSDDEYQFTFTNDPSPTPYQEYIQFNEATPWDQADDVVLFSGGLDSLAGAVEQIISLQKRLILVTHAPCTKFETWHQTLRAQINQRSGPTPPHYVKVTANKLTDTEEYTQRTRSFLYASLAATIANMTGKQRIRFFENGVTSLNLPINGQIIGSRATRTTHPETLRRFAHLFSVLSDALFVVENPFQWHTKTEIVKKILDLGCQGMIENSTSCAHTWRMMKLVSHCGTCSQCVDRRFATIAAGAKDHDPQRLYRKNLFTDALNDKGHDKDRTMAGSFAQTALAWERMTETQLLVAEGDLGPVLAALPGTPTENARKVVDLLHRHARSVKSAINTGIADYNGKLVDRVAIDPDSFIHMVIGRERGEPDKPVTAKSTISVDPHPVAANWFRPAGREFFVKIGTDGPHTIPNLIGAQVMHRLIQHRGKPVTSRELARYLYEQHSHLLKKAEMGKYQRSVQVIDEFTAKVLAWDAANETDREEAEEIGSTEISMEMVTEEGIEYARQALQQLQKDLTDDPESPQSGQMADDIAKLKLFLNRVTRPGRPMQPKTVNKALLRLQQVIYRNLQTTLNALHKASPTIATYFSTPKKGGHLTTGYRLVFSPPAGAEAWDTTATTLKALYQSGAVAS